MISFQKIREKEDVEKKIENIEKVIEEIELSMNENKRDGQKLKELYLEKEEYQNKIGDLMERWEELIILLGDE